MLGFVTERRSGYQALLLKHRNVVLRYALKKKRKEAFQAVIKTVEDRFPVYPVFIALRLENVANPLQHTMGLLTEFGQLALLCQFASALSPDYGKPVCVNSPDRRDCWTKGFDLHSDYEQVVPEGRLREVSDKFSSPSFSICPLVLHLLTCCSMNSPSASK